jgi:hypothetical protein
LFAAPEPNIVRSRRGQQTWNLHAARMTASGVRRHSARASRIRRMRAAIGESPGWGYPMKEQRSCARDGPAKRSRTRTADRRPVALSHETYRPYQSSIGQVTGRYSSRTHKPAAACRFLLVSLLLLIGALEAEELPETGETKIDEYHDLLAENVNKAAVWLDSFFEDENYDAEDNTTSFRLELSSFSESGAGTDFKARVGLRLRLPQLEDRLLLFVSGATEDFTTTGSDLEEVEDEFSDSDDDNLSIGLKYFFQQADKSNASLSAGLRFRSGSPVVYLRPRYRYLKRFSTFNLRFVQRFTWYTDSDLESRTQLEYDRIFKDDWFFRTKAQLDWYQDEDGVFPQLNFDLSHPLSERRVIAASWNNYFETEPDGVLDASIFKIRYRQQTWRKWFWFEVAPQVAFRRDDDYDATPGIQLKAEARFERIR